MLVINRWHHLSCILTLGGCRVGVTHWLNSPQSPLLVTPKYGYIVNCFHWFLLLVAFSSSSAFLRYLFTQSSHLSCGLPRFLKPSCFITIFVSDIFFGNLSSFILTMCPANIKGISCDILHYSLIISSIITTLVYFV